MCFFTQDGEVCLSFPHRPGSHLIFWPTASGSLEQQHPCHCPPCNDTAADSLSQNLGAFTLEGDFSCVATKANTWALDLTGSWGTSAKPYYSFFLLLANVWFSNISRFLDFRFIHSCVYMSTCVGVHLYTQRSERVFKSYRSVCKIPSLLHGCWDWKFSKHSQQLRHFSRPRFTK